MAHSDHEADALPQAAPKQTDPEITCFEQEEPREKPRPLKRKPAMRHPWRAYPDPPKGGGRP